MTQSKPSPGTLAPIAARLVQFGAQAAAVQARRLEQYGPSINAAPVAMCPSHPGVALRVDVNRSAYESARARRVVIVHHDCPDCIDARARQRLARQLIARGIPPRSLGITLETWQPDWEPMFADKRAKAWISVSAWTKSQDVPFLCILGGRGGTGKTALGVAALRAFGADIRALEFREWIGRLLGMESDDRQAHFERVRRYAGLMIDDFGNRFIGGRDDVGGNAFERDAMASVLNYRFENRLPTILTSNLDPVAFAARLDDRTVDRIRAGRLFIDASDWPSRRAAEGI